MKHYSLLIKPASSLCNMRCKYCFYYDVASIRDVPSYGMMSLNTVSKMLHRIFMTLKKNDHLTIAFQGGEPTLVGLDFYKFFIDCVNQLNNGIKVHYAIQTNGLILDHPWAQFFLDNDFLVGLSIDGPKKIHDSNRLSNTYDKTYERVLLSKKLLDQYDVPYNIVSVLTNEMAQNPDLIIKFLKNEKIEYVQFIPCLAGLQQPAETNEALCPELFYSFYSTLFTYWIEELKKGRYHSIKLFDDLYNLLVHRQVTACGMTGNCQIQHVVESDGSVYPCDFYVLDDYKLGSIVSDRFDRFDQMKHAQTFLNEKRKIKRTCKTCPYYSLCQGGCKRMEHSMYVNASDTYCGYQNILALYVEHLSEINSSIFKIHSNT